MGANESVPYVHTVRYRGRSIVFLLSQRESSFDFQVFQFRFSPVSCHVTDIVGHTYTWNLNTDDLTNIISSVIWTMKVLLQINQCVKLPGTKSCVSCVFGCEIVDLYQVDTSKNANFVEFFDPNHILCRDVKFPLHTVIIQIFRNFPKPGKGKQ